MLRKCVLFCAGVLGVGLIMSGAYIHAKAVVAQYLIKQSWQQSLDEQHPIRPWPWADTWPLSRFIMPDYKVDLFVLAGDSGRTLAFGPGLSMDSSLPGDGGNSLISAHRDTHFAFLKDVEPGDEFFIQNNRGELRHFVITQLMVLETPQFSPPVNFDQARVFLVTCYPFDSMINGGSQRFIAVAEEQPISIWL